MIKTLGNNIVSAFTGGNPVKAIYAYGQLVWPVTIESSYYIKWTPSSAEGQFNVDGTTYDLSTFGGLYYWSTGIINSSAFQNNYSIQSIETNATSIGIRAFISCSSLSQVSLPICSYIGPYAFESCSSLTKISLPMCSYIGTYAFNSCSSLSQVSLPVCSCIDGGTFGYCSSLSQVSLPICGYIGAYAFESCSSLTKISLPMCEFIRVRAFEYCRALSQVNLPICSYIAAAVFRYCSSLSRITIGYSSVCSLYSTNVFDDTQITSSTGSIYVPASLVDAYKSAENWSVYSNIIYPIN